MGTPNKDIVIKDDAPSELLLEKHLNFLVSYSEKKNDYEYVVTGTEHVGRRSRKYIQMSSNYKMRCRFSDHPLAQVRRIVQMS